MCSWTTPTLLRLIITDSILAVTMWEYTDGARRTSMCWTTPLMVHVRMRNRHCSMWQWGLTIVSIVYIFLAGVLLCYWYVYCVYIWSYMETCSVLCIFDHMWRHAVYCVYLIICGDMLTYHGGGASRVVFDRVVLWRLEGNNFWITYFSSKASYLPIMSISMSWDSYP